MVRVYSGILRGLDARLLTVEVDTDPRSFGFYLVGLADHAVREGQLRIQTAIRNAGYALPRCRHMINLAPADLRKEGAAYDLTNRICSPSCRQLSKKNALRLFVDDSGIRR